MTKAVIVAISLTEDSSSDNTGNINGSQMLMEVQKICVAYVKPALIWILMFFSYVYSIHTNTIFF